MITDVLPFRRPFGAFPFCACLSGASPLPVLCRLSEALSYKYCRPYQQTKRVVRIIAMRTTLTFYNW